MRDANTARRWLRRIPTIGLLIIFCVACKSSVHKPISAKEVANLKVGKTQRSEVVKHLGSPKKEYKSYGFLESCYHSLKGTIAAEDQVLYLEFDENGRLYTKHFNDRKAKKRCAGVFEEVTTVYKCYNRADCPVGFLCNSGSCLQTSSVEKKCIRGKFGAKVCTHDGNQCGSDADCA